MLSLLKQQEEEKFTGELNMRTKIVTVKVSYDTEETWDITLKEVKEIFQMMNNLKRNAVIIDIEQGANKNDDGQD
jgi:ABC-type oligopeptide transport system substrate-binding subunit|tara:strand:+ start:55 stop:279 length:225 start_codon:yes stop_codon:yes gene_type:complete